MDSSNCDGAETILAIMGLSILLMVVSHGIGSPELFAIGAVFGIGSLAGAIIVIPRKWT